MLRIKNVYTLLITSLFYLLVVSLVIQIPIYYNTFFRVGFLTTLSRALVKSMIYIMPLCVLLTCIFMVLLKRYRGIEMKLLVLSSVWCIALVAYWQLKFGMTGSRCDLLTDMDYLRCWLWWFYRGNYEVILLGLIPVLLALFYLKILPIHSDRS